MRSYRQSAFALVLTLALAVFSHLTHAACDRACLIDVTKSYLNALVAHDPGAAPLSEKIRFVENIKAMKPGEGLWQSAKSGPGNFAIYVPDEKEQSAGFLGMLTYMAAPAAPSGTSPEERAKWAETAEKTEQPVLVALRLKLDDNGKIAEAEHLLAGIRKPDANAQPATPNRPSPWDNLQTPRAGLFTEVPAGQRMDHDQLIKIGASYYDALDDNDGSLMPFATDCVRHENGMVTAGANAGAGPNSAGAAPIARDCAGQLTSKVMTYITSIDNRRVFAADPQTGLVMGLSHFRHPMDFEPYEVIALDGTKIMYSRDNQMKFAPFDLPAAHVYKISADGLVHEIEAMGFMAPYNSPTGWE
ncbi:MAG TPA: hypothetical protein VJN91_06775 [Gammaproteobacteria bacterium]|nr:hypothetical protein [Gammaproteobacteria bacterium]